MEQEAMKRVKGTWKRDFGMRVISMTYNLGFFFGPGLPRALEAESPVCPIALFVPALTPDPFFFGASVTLGPGVALLSEASAFGEDAGAVAAAGALAGVETVDGVDFALEFFRGVGFGRKRPRMAAGSLKTTTLLGLLLLSGRACRTAGEIVMQEEEVDMVFCG